MFDLGTALQTAEAARQRCHIRNAYRPEKSSVVAAAIRNALLRNTPRHQIRIHFLTELLDEAIEKELGVCV